MGSPNGSHRLVNRMVEPRFARCRRAYHSAMSTSALTTPRSAWAAWLPVLAWAAVIFAFSSIPSLGTGLGGWDLALRKLAHVTEYAILGALLLRALRHEPAALLVGVAYAASDELHQHFVSGRHAAPLDVAIDATGVAIGLLAWRRFSPAGA